MSQEKTTIEKKPIIPIGEMLSKFENVRSVPSTSMGKMWVASNEKGDYLEIFEFATNEIRFIIDNFPLQRKFYNTNIPYRSMVDFMSDLVRMGITQLKPATT